MQTITIPIPKQFTKEDDLVIISRKEYEKLLLDRDLNESIKQYKQGKAIGPFGSVRDLKKSLQK